MIGLLADENFFGPIFEGARRRVPTLDFIRVQDTAAAGEDDPSLLEFATRSGRLLLSHDVRTLIGFANQRVRAGIRTCGIIQVHRLAPLATIIEDLLLIAECLEPGEWDNLLKYVPLRANACGGVAKRSSAHVRLRPGMI